MDDAVQPPEDDIDAELVGEDPARSGKDIAEAIEVAERGSSVQEVHDRGTEDVSGQAPVEHTFGDPEMTEGQVVLGEEHGRHRAPDGS